jgi:hypothetical protein
MKRLSKSYIQCLCLFFIITYSSIVHAGLDLCGIKESYIMPSIGYFYRNQQSTLGANLSWRTGTLFCLWRGAYVEYFTNFKNQNVLGAGAFIGTILLGLDLAALHYSDSNGAEMMYRVRPVWSMLFIDLYAGVVINPEDSNTSYFSEIGFLLKYPLWKKTKHGSYMWW